MPLRCEFIEVNGERCLLIEAKDQVTLAELVNLNIDIQNLLNQVEGMIKVLADIVEMKFAGGLPPKNFLHHMLRTALRSPKVLVVIVACRKSVLSTFADFVLKKTLRKQTVFVESSQAGYAELGKSFAIG